MPKVQVSATMLLTALTAFLGGGLAGAVFTWYVNRPKPSVITYSVATATVAAADTASFMPNLKIAVGSEEVKSLYLHTVEFQLASGPFVQQADVVVEFPNSPRIYGMSPESPSPLHTIDCKQIDAGARCVLSPISPDSNRPFRILFATTEKNTPVPMLVANNVKLVSQSEYSATSGSSVLNWLKNREAISLVIATSAYLALSFFGIKKIRERSTVVVGRVLDPFGVPVQGAQIEFECTSPSAERLAHTDAMGDFIVGLKKIPMFSANVRISSPGFRTKEFRTDSAIIFHQYSTEDNIRYSELLPPQKVIGDKVTSS